MLARPGAPRSLESERAPRADCFGPRARLSWLPGVGVPEPAGTRGLGTHAAGFDRFVEVVPSDAPFLADLVRLEFAAGDPIADGLVLDLQASGDFFDLEELGLGWVGCRRHPGFCAGS